MKKILILTCLLGLFQINAQIYTPNGVVTGSITSSNNGGVLGIGTSAPSETVEIVGNVVFGASKIAPQTIDTKWIFHTRGDGKNLFIAPRHPNDQGWDWPKQTRLDGEGNMYISGALGINRENPIYRLDVGGNFRAGTDTNFFAFNGSDVSLKDINRGDNGHARALVHGGGNILIINYDQDFLGGTRIGKSFFVKDDNASVQGKLEAREVKVTQSPSADFVFEENYGLPTLEEVEKHIKEKKHLPEIASAKEMEKDGVNIGQFQIKLLQKIEELTLYSIEQNKLNRKQEEQIQQLKKENSVLKEESSKIKSLLNRVEKLEGQTKN